MAIMGIENVGKGLIRDGTGFVTFPVKYKCVVFRPFKGEILEAVVTMVNKVTPLNICWIRFSYGCFIDVIMVVGIWQMGFFAEAGPVQVFVSNHVSFL